MVLKGDSVKDVLPGRQILEQHLGCEIRFGQRSANVTSSIVLKLSVVDTSTCMRAGRSARAHTTASPAEASPD